MFYICSHAVEIVKPTHPCESDTLLHASCEASQYWMRSAIAEWATRLFTFTVYEQEFQTPRIMYYMGDGAAADT